MNRVVRNTLAAETIALSDAVDDGFCISEIVSELLFNGNILYNAIKSKKNVLEKRLRIDIAMLREMFE